MGLYEVPITLTKAIMFPFLNLQTMTNTIENFIQVYFHNTLSFGISFYSFLRESLCGSRYIGEAIYRLTDITFSINLFEKIKVISHVG